MATSNDLGDYAFTRKYIVSRNAPAKFKVATSNSLEEMTDILFSKKMKKSGYNEKYLPTKHTEADHH